MLPAPRPFRLTVTNDELWASPTSPSPVSLPLHRFGNISRIAPPPGDRAAVATGRGGGLGGSASVLRQSLALKGGVDGGLWSTTTTQSNAPAVSGAPEDSTRRGASPSAVPQAYGCTPSTPFLAFPPKPPTPAPPHLLGASRGLVSCSDQLLSTSQPTATAVPQQPGLAQAANKLCPRGGGGRSQPGRCSLPWNRSVSWHWSNWGFPACSSR